MITIPIKPCLFYVIPENPMLHSVANILNVQNQELKREISA